MIPPPEQRAAVCWLQVFSSTKLWLAWTIRLSPTSTQRMAIQLHSSMRVHPGP